MWEGEYTFMVLSEYSIIFHIGYVKTTYSKK